MKPIGKSGAAIATAAFALAVSGTAMVAPTTAIAEGENIHCLGVTSCKGHSDCATAENACKGQNACKGHGFVSMTAEQCEKIGGTVEG